MFDTMTPLDPAMIDARIDPRDLTDGHSGYTPELAALDTPEALRDACGDALTEFSSDLWLEPKDRVVWAQKNDELKTWAYNFISHFTNQSPTHECTCHDLVQGCSAARNKMLGITYPDGPKVDWRYPESAKGDVFLSPLSVYAEANPGRWGGAGCIQVLNIARRRGILPDRVQPAEYGFKHALTGTSGKGNSNQSGGDWVPLSRFPEGWQETASLFRPTGVIVTSDWEQALCLICRGYKGCYGRNGHAVGPSRWNVASNAFPYVDHYNVVRADSFSTFKSACRSGVYFVMTMTAPNDWQKPALA